MMLHVNRDSNPANIKSIAIMSAQNSTLKDVDFQNSRKIILSCGYVNLS